MEFLLSDGLALDGVRSFDAWEGDCDLEGSGGIGKLCLNFDAGNDCKEPVEGWFAAGRDGCGNVEVEVILIVEWLRFAEFLRQVSVVILRERSHAHRV